MGSLGPTNRTASISPDVTDTRARATSPSTSSPRRTQEAAEGLIAGGADLLVIETIFDTLNAKAAIFGVEAAFDATGDRIPLIISGTITDASGRTLSGQTVEAFCTSVTHARPIAVGLNCALGARQLRGAHRRPGADRRAAGHRLSERRPAQRVRRLRRDSRDHGRAPRRSSRATALINIAGGCCGTTPAHVQAIAEAVAGVRAASRPGRRAQDAAVRAPGARHPAARRRLRQRRRADQRHRLAQVRQAHPRGPLRRGGRGRPPAGRGRRPAHRRQHGRGDARLGRGDDPVPAPHRRRSRTSARSR